MNNIFQSIKKLNDLIANENKKVFYFEDWINTRFFFLIY